MFGVSSLPVGSWIRPTQTMECVESANRTSSIVASSRTGHQSGANILVLVVTITRARRPAPAVAAPLVAGRLLTARCHPADGLSPRLPRSGSLRSAIFLPGAYRSQISAAANPALAAPSVASSSARARKSVDFPPLPIMAVVFGGMCKSSLRMPTPRVSRARYARAEWAARDAIRPSRGKLPA